MELKPLTCPNCGGKVNRAKMVCEYCGTQFSNAEINMGIFRVEHYTSPTRIFETRVEIPHEATIALGEKSVEYAQKEVAKKMVDKLLQGEMVEFTLAEDFKNCQQILSARLRVLDPRFRF